MRVSFKLKYQSTYDDDSNNIESQIRTIDISDFRYADDRIYIAHKNNDNYTEEFYSIYKIPECIFLKLNDSLLSNGFINFAPAYQNRSYGPVYIEFIWKIDNDLLSDKYIDEAYKDKRDKYIDELYKDKQDDEEYKQT